MFMMVIAHAHERCFQLQEELDFRLYEAVLLFAGTQQPRTQLLAHIEISKHKLIAAHQL